MEPVGTVTTILLILVVMALVSGGPKPLGCRYRAPGMLMLSTPGPIFTLRFGLGWVVVVIGYEVVWEVLVNRRDEFTDRGQFPLAEKTNKGLGIFMSNGETWVQTQPFTLTMLRDFGMGKRSVEEQVQEEMGLLLQELAQAKGQLFDPAVLLSTAMGNTICHILISERFSYSDEEYHHVLWHLAENFHLESSIAGQVRVFLGGEFLARKVAEHKATLDLEAPQDFMDAFLCRMEQKGNPRMAFRWDNMHAMAFDMFVSGTESTSITLRYCLMLLLEHPEVAGKVQEEIEWVMGRERTPTLRDRGAMPYTEAVLHETLWFLDLTFIWRAKWDMQPGGFIIPKGCIIYPILSSTLWDPCHFKNPEAFDSRHFLDEKRGFKKSEAFMPFSAGGWHIKTPPALGRGGHTSR
uniref:Cytochrome P450 n=1 Tax=Accipiter nisus TaxID=211598 RepID=A0A8B9NB72_9AVES